MAEESTLKEIEKWLRESRPSKTTLYDAKVKEARESFRRGIERKD